MNKIFKVARREYIETVKTKTFLLGILFSFILIGVVFLISFRLQKKTLTGSLPDRHVTVVNYSGELVDELGLRFESYNESHQQRKIIITQVHGENQDTDAQTEKLKEDVLNGNLDAYCIIESDVLENSSRIKFYTVKMTDFEFFSTIQRLVNDAVFNSRLRLNDLSPQLIGKLRRRVPVDQINLKAQTEKKQDMLVTMLTPFFFLLLMFIGIFSTSQGLLMSVVEEKSSRVIEVLLSALSPFQLMAGKIVGQSAVGFTIVAIYGTVAYTTAMYRGMGDLMNPGIFVYFIIYYVLGFLLISSMLVAIGSTCNEIKEAQGLMGPIMILLMIPMFVWFNIVQQPEGTLSIVLSFIPPMTPIIMILRIAAQPDLSKIQIAASIALLAVSIPVVMWAASKIFRIGILMYGKHPSFREMLRWIKS